jgi:hypothetical protein
MQKPRWISLYWIVLRVILPLATAFDMMTRRWQRENIYYALVVPVFILVAHLSYTSRAWPVAAKASRPRGWWMLYIVWSVLEAVALVSLFIFEIGTAMIAEGKGLPWGQSFLLVLLLYVFPYLTLTLAARGVLWKARRLLARAQTADGGVGS